MICSLGSFVFFAEDILGLNGSFKATFGEYKPISSDTIFYATQGTQKEITIKGRYIASPNSLLSVLEGIAKQKKPVRFTLATGVSLKVLIESIDADKKNFLPFSGAVNVDFVLKLKRVKITVNIYESLGGLLASL